MKSVQIGMFRMVAIATVAAVGVLLSGSACADGGGSDESKIRQGFAIAPVTLDLAGKNHASVGLGSYIVNAQGGCNDCHTNPSYAPGGNPYLGEPKKINAAGYLGGGAAFGPFVSRNLTPDKSGLPAGSTLAEFMQTMRTGIDHDHAHPQFGPFLQVMPWPLYQDMTDRDLRAIYDYLSTIPCVEGDPGIPGAPATGRCL